MRCISIHSPILPRFPEPSTFMHQLTSTPSLRFPNNASTALLQRCKTNTAAAAAATPSSLFLAAAVPPATSGDYTVLLQTGLLINFLCNLINAVISNLINGLYVFFIWTTAACYSSCIWLPTFWCQLWSSRILKTTTGRTRTKKPETIVGGSRSRSEEIKEKNSLKLSNNINMPSEEAMKSVWTVPQKQVKCIRKPTSNSISFWIIPLFHILFKISATPANWTSFLWFFFFFLFLLLFPWIWRFN